MRGSHMVVAEGSSRQSDDSVSVRIYASFEGLDGLRRDWDRLVLRLGGDIYLTYDWCRVWWETYGQGRDLALFVYARNQELVGIAPMFIDCVRLGPVRIRVARVVGSDFGLGLFAPLFSPGDEESAVESLLLELTGVHQCDAVILGPAVNINGLAGVFRSVATRRPDLVGAVVERVRGPYMFFELPETFDAYVKSLSQNQRNNYRRQSNLLRRERQGRLDVVSSGPSLAEEFKRFQTIHRQQWRADNKLGHFDDWPKAAGFHEALTMAQSAHGRVRLLRLSAGDEVAAYEYAYAFGGRYHWLLPARSVGEEWHRYGLGRQSLIGLFQTAIDEGVRLIDAGPGHYDYKVQLGAVERPAGTLVALAPGTLRARRFSAFATCSKLLHKLYYRLWYSRLAPRLPLPRRPLRSCWIRSRL